MVIVDQASVLGILPVPYVIAASGLALAWLTQLYMVFPFEQFLRGDGSDVATFSYLFLPHGVKVLIGLIFMSAGLPIIFLVQVAAGLVFGKPVGYAVISAAAASLAIIVPLWVLNMTMRQPLDAKLWSLSRSNFNLFRLAVVLSLAAALVDSVFQATIAEMVLGHQAGPVIALGFLAGDVIGGVTCIMTAIYISRLILQRRINAL